jgi:hypothetical protein
VSKLPVDRSAEQQEEMIGHGSVAGGPPECGPEKWRSTGSCQPLQVTRTHDLWTMKEWLPWVLVGLAMMKMEREE